MTPDFVGFALLALVVVLIAIGARQKSSRGEHIQKPSALDEWFDVDGADLQDAIVRGAVAMLLGGVAGVLFGAAYTFFVEGVDGDDLAVALVIGAVIGAIGGLLAFIHHNVE